MLHKHTEHTLKTLPSGRVGLCQAAGRPACQTAPPVTRDSGGQPRRAPNRGVKLSPGHVELKREGSRRPARPEPLAFYSTGTLAWLEAVLIWLVGSSPRQRHTHTHTGSAGAFYRKLCAAHQMCVVEPWPQLLTLIIILWKLNFTYFLISPCLTVRFPDLLNL